MQASVRSRSHTAELRMLAVIANTNHACTPAFCLCVLQGITPLLRICDNFSEIPNVDAIRLLLLEGADVNAVDSQVMSHHAA